MTPMGVRKDSLVLVGHSRAIYLLFLTAVGAIFYCADKWGWVSNGTLAWAYVLAHAYLWVVLVTDISRNGFLFLILFVAVVGLSMWLIDVLMTPVWGPLFEFLGATNLYYSRKLGVALGVAALVLNAFTFVYAICNNRWILRHNILERRVLFMSDTEYPTPKLTIRITYPDWFELWSPFLAGDIEVYQGEKLLFTIRNIIFLFVYQGYIRRFLAKIATTDGGHGKKDHDEHEGHGHGKKDAPAHH